VGLSEEESKVILEMRVTACSAELERAFPDIFPQLLPVRQAVLIDMLYNLGLPKLSKFKKMLKALREADYDNAAAEMLDSKWRRDVGRRSFRLAEMMQHGEWPKDLPNHD
jgi:lysozyme